MTKNIKFLAEIKENEKVVVEIFIPQIYETLQYYCKNCRKFSEELCECGNFPQPIFQISGLVSDGTKTIPFKTLNEKVSESLSGIKKIDAKKLNPKEIMSKPHVLEGYLNKNRFWIEEVF